MNATKGIASALLLGTLFGCASQERIMQAQILSAPEELAGRTEILPIRQVLRPHDVLEVIYHIALDSNAAYRIQSGDQLDLNFVSARGMSGSKTVMPDGTVSLEYVGSVKVSGLTVKEVEAKLVALYAQTLRNPIISASVPRAQSNLQNLRDTLFSPGGGMSREITIGPDGRATFPMLGSMSLAGVTLDDLQQTLSRRYASEVGPLKVDVLLKNSAANEVFVLGEVGQPGAYAVRRPISVLEALTLARGYTPRSNLSEVMVINRQGEQVITRTYDIKAVLKDKAAAMAYLQPDDLLFIPKTGLAEAGDTVRQLSDVILFSGFNFGFSYEVNNGNN
ncbi:MAG TPA: polysaccharide biosynthesis/export family protein [Pseudomonas sp.]|jgi:polysaccharide export outer membrane protein|nr:polysaccharide biosynthesis/export family protein [Pseudomonas sp.]